MIFLSATILSRMKLTSATTAASSAAVTAGSVSSEPMEMTMLKSTVLALALCLPFTVAAHAGEPFKTAGVFCDTREQAIEFLGAWDGTNSAETVKAINDKNGGNACLGSGAYVTEDETYETVTTSTGTWLLVKVTIYAVGGPEGWMVIAGLTQYTSRKVSESKSSAI